MFNNTNATFASIVHTLMNLVYTLEWLLSGIAFGLFVYGMVVVLFRGENILEKTNGRKFMLWGVVALFVIFSIQGILYFFCTSLFSTTAQCSFFYATGGAPT